MWILLRVIIGGVFIFSGLGKLLSSYQNFLYVVQAYQLLPSWGETLVAQVFPWVELIIGTFVILGLWTHWSLKGALTLFGNCLGGPAQGIYACSGIECAANRKAPCKGHSFVARGIIPC